jgi:hypothetical protein
MGKTLLAPAQRPKQVVEATPLGKKTLLEMSRGEPVSSNRSEIGSATGATKPVFLVKCDGNTIGHSQFKPLQIIA